MTGFVVERHGYIKASVMTADIIQDMIANGFKPKYVSNSDTGIFNKADLGDVYRVVLEAGPDVDPLNATAIAEKQPWRVCFDVQNAQQVMVVAGTPTTLPDDGTLPVTRELLVGDPTRGAGFQPTDIIGVMGAKLTEAKFKSNDAPNVDITSKPSATDVSRINGYIRPESLSVTGVYSAPGQVPAYISTGDKNPTYIDGYTGSEARYANYFLDNANLKWVVNPAGAITGGTVTEATSNDIPYKLFVNRALRMTGASLQAYPMSYRLVISPRGMWLGYWEEATTAETSAAFNWFLIQRPVDRATGQTLTTGKAPVFCVNGSGQQYWQFTVREQDILRPGKRRSATTDEIDSECILNNLTQVALSEDGKYIVTFPSRLNTSRYRYPHELDMIGLTSADVVSQYTDVPLRVYGESEDRIYKALHANGTANTGMRILVLQKGGSIS